MTTYKSLTQLEHLKLRTAMYVGSCVPYEKTIPVWDGSGMIQKTVSTNDGLMKIFFEAIDNSVDNTLRSPPTTHIKVSIDSQNFSISNDGQHIPVKQQDEKWIPSFIFSEFLSGSNFHEDRAGAGMNGLGIKLAAGLSDTFKVTVLDPTESKKFVQCWKNGLTEIGKPKVTTKQSSHKNFTTTVEFTPTLAHFGEQSLEHLIEQVHTRLLQIAATCAVKITFNGKMVKTNNFKKYIGTFGFDKYMYDTVSPTFEFGLALSDGEFKHQSFVNNLCTTDGGTHVKLVEFQVVSTLLEYFKKKCKGSAKLTRHNIRQKLFVFVNVTKLRNPSFKSQSKVFLTTPMGSAKIDPKKIIANCKKMGLLDQLEELLTSKDDKAMSDAMSASKKKSISVPKLIDASWAGTAKSNQCSLYLTEGDSARTFVVSGLGKIGPKTNGVFPL